MSKVGPDEALAAAGGPSDDMPGVKPGPSRATQGALPPPEVVLPKYQEAVQPPVQHTGPYTVPTLVTQPAPTVVVMQAPPTETKSKRWATGLFGCFADMPACVAAFCCTCCYLVYLSDKAGENIVGAIICSNCYLIGLRTMLRSTYHIKGDIMGDAFAAYVCTPCSLRQIGTEMKRQQLVEDQTMARS